MAKRSAVERAIPDVVKRINWMQSAPDNNVACITAWDFNSDAICGAIAEILEAGDAVMFGRTRDGSALTITIFQDEHRDRTFVTDSFELNEWATGIRQAAAAFRKENTPRLVSSDD